MPQSTPCIFVVQQTHCQMNRVLLLRIENDRSILDKDDDSGVQRSGHNIAHMVSINKSTNLRGVTSGFWHLRWQFLCHISIEVCPICIRIKSTLINHRCLRVINQSARIRMLLHIRKHDTTLQDAQFEDSPDTVKAKRSRDIYRFDQSRPPTSQFQSVVESGRQRR